MRLLATVLMVALLAGCSVPKVYKAESIAGASIDDLERSYNYWGDEIYSTWFLSPEYETREAYLDTLRDELANRADCDQKTRSAILNRQIYVGMPKWAAWLSWGPWFERDETRYRTAYSDTVYVTLRRSDTVQLRFENDVLRNWFIVER